MGIKRLHCKRGSFISHFPGIQVSTQEEQWGKGCAMIETTENVHALEWWLSREWLETNGLGGYASSTIAHCHTRKYHGLLVANLHSRGGRHVLLSKIEDSVHSEEGRFYLSIHKYPMVYFPSREPELPRVTYPLYPRFTYRTGSDILKKELMLVEGDNTLILRYSLESDKKPYKLTIKPLLAFRGIHALAHENDSLNPHTANTEEGFSIAPYHGMPRLFFRCNKPVLLLSDSDWYRNFEYSAEKERGYEYQEDLFMPGTIECALEAGEELLLSVSLDEKQDIEKLWEREVQRRRRRFYETKGESSKRRGSFAQTLSNSAHAFIIRNAHNTPSVIAGYHWFYVWGRDTLISLPGLTIYRGRKKEALEILKHIGTLRENGLIPNFVAEEGNARAYNSVDASLWYFWCVQELLKHTGDIKLIARHFLPVMRDIAECYVRGIPGVVVHHENGLICAGDASTQLTWMDASVKGVPVTPRSGCPVEINALWFNALSFLKELSGEINLNVQFDLDEQIEKTKKSFNVLLWSDRTQCLADLWIPWMDSRDESVRPNQVFAVSLPYSPIDLERARLVMKKVTDELLTPFGLRTLSPRDPRYQSVCDGPAESRDAAYHQGTVWPWLLGHYGEGMLKTSEHRDATKHELMKIIFSMEAHLNDAGIGHISEIFDGEYPHRPRGCIAQAWSSAELLRLCALMEI